VWPAESNGECASASTRPAPAKALAAEARQSAAPSGTGTSFLLRKKQEQEASRDLAGRLRAEVDAGWPDLAAQAAEAVRRSPATAPEQGGKVFLDAALLVPADRTAELEAAVDRFATRVGPKGGEVTLTGPWPPYTYFVEETPVSEPGQGDSLDVLESSDISLLDTVDNLLNWELGY